MQLTQSTTVGEFRDFLKTDIKYEQIFNMCYSEKILTEFEDERLLFACNALKFGKLQEAMNRSFSLLERGEKIIYDLYTSEEMRENPGKEKVKLLYYPGQKEKPFVIILPGGGYATVATLDEGIPIAIAFNEMGYSAFVLNYRVSEIETVMPGALEDLARAVQFITGRADLFPMDVSKYLLAGFSSGGHLGGMWCSSNHGYESFGLSAPEALFLAYPLVSMRQKVIQEKYGMGTARDLFHARRSVRLVCGDNYTPEILAEYDVAEQINSNCPPVYIVHGDMDPCVYFRDSELLAEALKKRGIPYEFHLLKNMGHAFGNGFGTAAEGWMEKAICFWQQHKKEEG